MRRALALNFSRPPAATATQRPSESSIDAVIPGHEPIVHGPAVNADDVSDAFVISEKGRELKLFGETWSPAVHADLTIFDLHDAIVAAVRDQSALVLSGRK